MSGVGIGSAIGEDVSFLAGGRSFASSSTQLESAFGSFWKSLSSGARSFLGGKGGTVLKAGAQVGTAVALPAVGVYSLNQALSAPEKQLEQLTGIQGSGSLLFIGLLVFIAIIFIMVLVK